MIHVRFFIFLFFRRVRCGVGKWDTRYHVLLGLSGMTGCEAFGLIVVRFFCHSLSGYFIVALFLLVVLSLLKEMVPHVTDLLK